MAPDGLFRDPGVVFRSKPLFLKSVVSDFKSKHIPPPRWLPLVRSGSFLSPGPSNSKQGNVAGSHSAVFSNEGDEPSRKPSTHQHRVCALGSWLRWPLIYPCILPPLPVLCAALLNECRVQSECSRGGTGDPSLCDAAAGSIASHMHLPFLRRLWII